MNEFTSLLKRVDLSEIMGYLIYGIESDIKHTKTYEERIRESYDKILATLENLFPTASRHNEDLYGAILDFSIVHHEIYLEMGLIAGFQLRKTLEEKSLELAGLQSIIEKNCSVAGDEPINLD